MMSSQYDQRSLIEALDSGADDFIGKPPLAEELYARLRAVERLASTKQSSRLLRAGKQINDAYGHETGDDAIRACARAAHIDEAVTGRLGGDEFALILEEKSLPQAINIAEGLRKRLAERPFDTGKGRIRLTCRFGVGRRQGRRHGRPDSGPRRCGPR
jgi:two-component system cell cycle response regulator